MDFASSNLHVVAWAPLRVSLAGGGTDLPAYAAKHGGLVVGIAINRYVSVATHPGECSACGRAALPETEMAVRHQLVDESSPFRGPACRRAHLDERRQISTTSDVPVGSGLGGSGAFSVALLQALLTTAGRFVAARELAATAFDLEHGDIGRPVGMQDHYMAAYGGIQILHINRALEVEVESIPITAQFRDYIERQLMLFHSGQGRDSGSLLADQQTRFVQGEDAVVQSLRSIHQIALSLSESMRSGRVQDIGPAIHEHWAEKRRLSPAISNEELDKLVAVAAGGGADGAKIVGAGGGGYLLASAPAGKQEMVRESMSMTGATELLFHVEKHGSQVRLVE